MSGNRRDPGARKRRGFVIVAGVLLVGMVGMTGYGIASSIIGGSASDSAAPAPSGSAGTTAAKKPSVPTLAHSEPSRLSIPSIKVDSALTKLGVDSTTKTVRMPTKAGSAGWFDQSATPGQQGTSILVGYIEYEDEKGVFSRLSQLKSGNELTVRRQDGKTAVYRVDSITSYPKGKLPTQKVFATSTDPVLRVITVGGALREGEPVSNVVVDTHLVSTR